MRFILTCLTLTKLWTLSSLVWLLRSCVVLLLCYVARLAMHVSGTSSSPISKPTSPRSDSRPDSSPIPIRVRRGSGKVNGRAATL